MLGLLAAALTLSLALQTYAGVVSNGAIDKRSTTRCTHKSFTQPVDHFGKHNGTFQQRYNIDATYFQPGGPIFFSPAGESAELPCTDDYVFPIWAQELNGLSVILEHRYFGESKPLGASDPMKQLEEFQYLTLDNVIEDATYFVEQLKKNFTGAEDSKVIIASGSYAGVLATLFRINKLDTFFGAIASAADLLAVTADVTAPTAFDAWIWINNVYQDASAQASANIAKAYRQLEDMFLQDDPSNLKKDFGLCQSVTAENATSAHGNFLGYLSLVYQAALLFNYAVPYPGKNPVPEPFNKIISISLEEKDSLHLLNKTVWMWFGPEGPDLPCLDLSPAASTGAVAKSAESVDSSTWSLAICRYFPQGAVSNIPAGTIFPPQNGSAEMPALCKDMYGIEVPTQKELRTRYNYTDADLRNSTRIVWSSGQYDPTSGIAPHIPGKDSPLPSTDRNASRILQVDNIAHVEELFAPTPSDRHEVVAARKQLFEIIKGWLDVYDLQVFSYPEKEL